MLDTRFCPEAKINAKINYKFIIKKIEVIRQLLYNKSVIYLTRLFLIVFFPHTDAGAVANAPASFCGKIIFIYHYLRRIRMNIAIDGPAGSGKSTVAKLLAKELSFIYLDTGAIYRTMALYCVRNNIDPKNEEEVSKAVPSIDVKVDYVNLEQHMLLNGKDVTGQIRTPEVSNATSVISAYSSVRDALLSMQRQIAEENDVIMDGRDIGTMVLPNAQCKIFLTASVGVRAKRRYDELLEKGTKCELSQIEKEIEERDYRDSHRKIAPLKKADDAIAVDTSDLSIEEVTRKLKEIAEGKM